MIRCKFKVDSITRRPAYPKGEETHDIKMSAVIADSGNEENDLFFKYTPAGDLEFSTVNADAVKDLVPGGEYYIDITPAPTEVN